MNYDRNYDERDRYTYRDRDDYRNRRDNDRNIFERVGDRIRDTWNEWTDDDDRERYARSSYNRRNDDWDRIHDLDRGYEGPQGYGRSSRRDNDYYNEGRGYTSGSAGSSWGRGQGGSFDENLSGRRSSDYGRGYENRADYGSSYGRTGHESSRTRNRGGSYDINDLDDWNLGNYGERRRSSYSEPDYNERRRGRNW